MASSENIELEELIQRATSNIEGQTSVGGVTISDQNIPESEEGLDLSALILIARRSLPWVVLLLIISLTTSWLYLRYTKPIYKASSLLKIDERSDANTLGLGALGGEKSRSATQLAGEVELIKSDLTYKRVKQNIPLDVNYYTQGTVLENELFNTSPFKVEYIISDQIYYNRKFDIEYLDTNRYRVKVVVADQALGGIFTLSQWAKLPGIQLRLLPTSNSNTGIADAAFHFTIQDDNAINNYLNKNLSVEVINPNANTIQISFVDYNRLKAQHLVNSLDSVYLAAKLERKQESTAKALAYLDSQLKENGNRLENAEDNLQGFVQKSGTYDAKSELGSIRSRLDALRESRATLEQKSLILAEVSRLAAQERLTAYDDQTISQTLPGLSELADPILTQSLIELDATQKDLRRISRSYNTNTEAVAERRALLEDARTAVRRQLRQAQKQLSSQLALLDQQQAELTSKLSSLPSKETELARLNRPLALYGNTQQMLMEKKVEYNIQNSGTTPDFQILSPAFAPDAPISPVKLLVYAIGVASGLILGLGLIATRYLLHNTITSIQELERNTKASVLGVIPTYEKEKLEVSRLVVDKNPKSSVSEAIRSIRTNLDFISPATKHRLISVTSTISGEGKTFVTVNLGGIIALSGQRVIILDLDMRKPKVNLAFGAENVRGISTILIDRHTVTECIQHSSIKSLDFISAGPTPPNPSELILSPRFDQMLEELYRTYDVVMIDTPPVGLVTDGILIMRKADVPIYIVRANYSRKAFLKNMNRLMRTNQLSRLCTILNDARSQGAYGYGYGYGYGHGYGSYGMGYYEEPSEKKTFAQRFKGLFS